MKFKNTDEITKYFQKQLDSGNTEAFKALQSKNGGSIPVVSKAALKEAAETLKNYLHARIKAYFDSYDPIVYERTGQFLDSLEVEPIEIDGVQSYRVFFDENKVVRDSVFDGGSSGYLPELLSSGWEVSSGWHKDIPHFGFFEGAGFITNAINDAENDDKFKGIKIVFNAGSPF